MKNRKLLMIPGPIEFEPAVMTAMGEPTTSHVAPDFIEAFGQALENMRRVFLSQDGQPFILAGSGTLAMDTAACNLVEAGDRVLVINTGYFGDRFGIILERYGAKVTHLRAPIGGSPSLEALENALKEADYKLVTITQVDTSTGVLADVQGMAAQAKRYGALVVVDGVCSVAGEELRMSDWGVDLALTASQKAIGVPPGLALLVVGPEAMQAFEQRDSPVGNYYADWNNWLPIMRAYEDRSASYFATPAVNLVQALQISLGLILAEGMQARFERHQTLSEAVKQAVSALGLEQVPLQPDLAAHTMTAVRYPPGVVGGQFLKNAGEAGVILAGGLHPEIKTQYFRIGHMGAVTLGDVLATVGAIETALAASGYKFQAGAGLEAAGQALTRSTVTG